MEPDRKNAFVVWIDLARGPAGTADRYQGRIEHVSTSTRERFSSKEELLAFMERFTRAVGEGRGGDESSP